MADIGIIQLKLISKAEKFLNSFSKDFFYPFKNRNIYLTPVFNSLGLIKIKNLLGSRFSFIQNFNIILRDILYGSYYFSNNIKEYIKNKNFKIIVVSWAKKENFKKNGIFKDKYFNVTNKYKKKSILWYLVYLDKNLPNKISENIILYQPIKNKFPNLILLLVYILRNLKNIFISLEYFVFSISSQSILADQISKNFSKYTNSNKEIKNVYIPYEGQPFQNEIIRLIKNYIPKAKITGYIHAPPQPIPTNLLKKSNKPHTIIVNGNDQKNCMKKLLGWKNNDILVKPSSRFLIQNSMKKKNIYLPVNISNKKKVLSCLKKLQKLNYINLHDYKIKVHPAAMGSNNISYLVKSISEIKKNKLKFKKNVLFQDCIIFIGMTGGIIEALERNIKLIHITQDNEIDMYNKDIWPNIIAEKLYDNIYIYKLKKKGQMLKFGTNKTKYF